MIGTGKYGPARQRSEPFDAQRALAVGLVGDVVDDARERAQELLAQPPCSAWAKASTNRLEHHETARPKEIAEVA
ncbi:hypothetical protein [Streptosporangium roseum]|uniref:Uncharacterized protein n=1 Tax=Streptosporangium roseum (strain ATCC 12428 / DSM 43021 / JCM 3005 / KCTC 9067 / NCIMB 10171 / NRRL 2505 / NI 9100) TaxID=479432 RepID=D2BAB7_STRRD|nr:hypothetical protein [Streptosporangium roseum]ACZ87942.1 hypothetical protein Sros_5164 [Streptosporangium roseum DSM 43021]